jgi:DsbC/DsbD-like thiol-disulfide interchange protein
MRSPSAGGRGTPQREEAPPMLRSSRSPCRTSTIPTAIIAVFAALLFSAPSKGQFPPGKHQDFLKPGEEESTDLVRAELLADHDAVAPGQEIRLAVALTIKKDWGVYYRNAGSTGLPTDFEITAPKGFAVGDVRWPAPERKIMPGDMLDYIYRERVLFIIPVKAAADLEPDGEATFNVNVSWLACKQACVMGGAELELTIPIVGRFDQPDRTKVYEEIAKTDASIPKPAEKLNIDIETTWEQMTLRVAVKDADELTFFPDPAKRWGIDNPVHTAHVKGDLLEMPILDRRIDRSKPISGVLRIVRGKRVDFAVIEANTARRPEVEL